MQVIIFRNDAGGISTLFPTDEGIEVFGSIEAIAENDIPEGRAFAILNASDLPQVPQEQWEVNDSDLTNGPAGAIINVVPAAPPPAPEEISDRQFFQALATEGLITQDEALSAVRTGDMPAAIVAFIDRLPDDQRFSARMLFSGATTFRRSHPLTAAFGEMYGLNGQQIDNLWRLAAGL